VASDFFFNLAIPAQVFPGAGFLHRIECNSIPHKKLACTCWQSCCAFPVWCRLCFYWLITKMGSIVLVREWHLHWHEHWYRLVHHGIWLVVDLILTQTVCISVCLLTKA